MTCAIRSRPKPRIVKRPASSVFVVRNTSSRFARMRDPNRKWLLERMAPLPAILASHDDRTEEEIDENHRDGIRISEFPVSMVAAKAARVP